MSAVPQKGQTVLVLDPASAGQPIEAVIREVRGRWRQSIRLSIDSGRELRWSWYADEWHESGGYHRARRTFYLDRPAWDAAVLKLREQIEEERREVAERERRRQIESVLRDYASRIRNGGDVRQVLGEVRDSITAWLSAEEGP